ncbi:MAG TPA: NAD-dependent epimerase/dehydratase family protein [Acidimicrobiales bacterium]|nr:NAD-dependent epimerase/dehydratase family protein [Acidimicrobiales bacterium]
MTGATGHLGSRLLPLLLADPAVTNVRTVARRGLPQHPKLVHTEADLRQDTARSALEGVDVLYHLGFALWRSDDAAHVNFDGTRNVLAARPARVVLASSAAVYGAWPNNPLPLTEDHWPRPNPECPYAVDKLRAERLCQTSAPTLVLRIGAVLGPHADPRVAKAVHGYRLGVPAPMGKDAALQFLHEDDAATALHAAGAAGATGVLNIAPPDWAGPQRHRPGGPQLRHPPPPPDLPGHGRGRLPAAPDPLRRRPGDPHERPPGARRLARRRPARVEGHPVIG